MNRTQKVRLDVIVDFLTIVWFLLSAITWFNYKSNVANIEFVNRLVVVFLYFVCRVGLIKNTKSIELTFLLVLFFLYIYELSLGYLQLFKVIPSNDLNMLTIGSFSNSGPYGSFIAICDVVFTVYYYENHNKKHSVVFIIASILGFILLPSIRSRTAILSLITGLCIYFGLTNKNKIYKSLPYILMVLMIFGISAYFYKKNSAQGRIFMSKINIQALFECGFTGKGLGSYSGVYGNQQFCYFYNKMNGRLDESLLNERERMVADCPNVSFNDFLGIGIESGIITMVVYITIIACSLHIALRKKSVWSYGLIAYSMFALFYYPSKLLLFNLLFPILLAFCVSSKRGNNKTIIYYSIPVSLLSLFLMIYLYPINKNYNKSISTWSSRTSRQYSLGKYEKVIEGCDTLEKTLNSYPPFMFAYGRTLNILGDYQKSDSILLIGAEYSSDPMFWNIMGNNSLALGNYREAENRYMHAFFMVPNRLYPLYLLAKLYYIEGDTTRFLIMADKVESFIPKVESTKTEKLRTEISVLKDNL